MRVAYSPRYEVTLPGHVWPTAKYRLIAGRIAAWGSRVELFEPAPAGWDDLALAHTADYLDKLRAGTLSAEDIATLELPWQPHFAEAFRVMAGGTIAAAAAALDDGRAAHLGGGLHHAVANHGEGFCPLNDVAVAQTLTDGLIGRAPASSALVLGTGTVLGWLARGVAEIEPQMQAAWQRFVERKPFWH